MGSSLHLHPFLTSELDRGARLTRQYDRCAPQEMASYPLSWILGPRADLDGFRENIFLLLGSEPPTAQSVVSRYNDCAISAPSLELH